MSRGSVLDGNYPAKRVNFGRQSTLLVKRGQEELIASALDQNNSPGDRIASFLLALGLQPIRDEMPR